MELPGGEEEEEEQEREETTPLTDPLKLYIRDKRNRAFKLIIDAAKLIAPVIESEWITGFDWVIETLKAANCPVVESEIEIFKAM
mmetsp:Transcript_9239/g.4888  ORF Transcript_9239/g.4888 Transcript_9239/m.4888 type:complete len:85 (+) Transcript_9239:667-921(+)